MQGEVPGQTGRPVAIFAKGGTNESNFWVGPA
jgi:hypothetical protein